MAKKPRVVTEFVSTDDFLDWLTRFKQQDPAQSQKILDDWIDRLEKWEKKEWGSEAWSKEEAEQRAAAYARGRYYYDKYRPERAKYGKMLKQELGNAIGDDKAGKLIKKYKGMDAHEKRKFVDQSDLIPNDKIRDVWRKYMRSGRAETRAMDMFTKFSMGPGAQPGPPPSSPPPTSPPPTPPPPSSPPPTSPPPPSSGGRWYNLSVNVRPREGGTTTPQAGEIYHYFPGSTAKVQAIPAAGYRLVAWIIDGMQVQLGPNDRPVININMNENHSVIAVFGTEERGEEEGKKPPDVFFTDRCPHCRIPIDNIRDHIPLRIRQWRAIYRRVGDLDWGICDACSHAFVIDAGRLRLPTLSERIEIEQQIARFDTSVRIRRLHRQRAGLKRDSKEYQELSSQIEKERSEYRSEWGSINVDDNGNVTFLNRGDEGYRAGFKEDAWQRRRQILAELGMNEDVIDNLERNSTNISEFDHEASRALGRFRPLSRLRRLYKQRLDEEEDLLADHHGIPEEEKERLRNKRQERASFDLGFFNKIGKKVGHTNERILGSFIMIIAGVIVASFMRDMWFFYGFLCFGFYGLLPNTEEVTYSDDILSSFSKAAKKEAKGGEKGEYTVSARLGPLLPAMMFARASVLNRDNTYNSGLAFLKVMLKVLGIFFIGYGLYASPVPLAAFVFLLFVFGAYYSLPISYDVEKPDEFFGSTMRWVLGLFIPFTLYSIFGVGSGILFWITLAFLFVFPAAKAKTEAKALNMAVTAGESHREMIDRVIFVLIMLLAVGIFMGLLPSGGVAGFEGTSNTVFWAVWGLGLFSGALSPAEVRPWTGVLVIIVTFFLFMTGPGQEAVGEAFLGQWWPTVHNMISALTEPFGDLFNTLQETFSQTWTLFTNPMGFAKNIMEGSYVKNPHGPTGSFGVEIESLQVPAIYPGTTAMLTMNVHNVGPEKGRNVKIKVSVPDDLKDSISIAPDDGEFTVPSIEQEYIIPLFFTLDTNCDQLIRDGHEPGPDRNKYIRVNVSIEYDYEVSSWMPLTIISDQEWRDRSAKGVFTLSKVGSQISTSPAKLSIGSFDQPLIAGNDRRYFLGFNLSSAEGPESAIIWNYVDVTFDFPEELKQDPLDRPPVCTPTETTSGPPYKWTEFEKYPGRAIFCTFSSTPAPRENSPSETFYVRANATFKFRKWETKDTLFAFNDVCA